MVAHKKAIEYLWKDTCTIIEYQEYKKTNKSTGHKEVIVLENQPCKLSFVTLKSANQTDSVAILTQTAKLFISTDITIKPNSKIVIQHRGRTFEYKQSGEAGIFSYHQEIMLEIFKGFA